MDVVIREANAYDIEYILPIWVEFMAFLEGCNPDYWETKDGESAFNQHLSNAIEEPRTFVAVAEVDGVLVGFCLAYIEKLPAWFAIEKIGLIRYLAVLQDYRQGGIGQKLVRYMLEWFRTNGVERVEVFVLKGIPASSFWTKLGFKEFMDRRFLEI